MHRNFLFLPFILLALLFTGCDNTPKIAVIDSEKIIAESEAGKAAMAHLEKLSSKVQEEIIALQEDMEKATDEGKEAVEMKFQDAFRKAQQRFSMEQQNIFAQVDDLYTKALDDLRTDKKLDAVFEITAVISHDKRLDISREVIDRMNGTPLNFTSSEALADVPDEEPAISQTPLTPEEGRTPEAETVQP